MLFKDYFDLIKKYCKKKPSDSDLCRDLFNSVIENTDDENAFYDYDKSVVSRILKGERGIPSSVRDHIYDETVEEGISDYFTQFIVPQLIPEHSDLIHEIIVLLENYPNISKPHLSTIKSLAKSQILGSFLAEVFRYSVIEGNTYSATFETDANDKADDILVSDRKPLLSLRGISNDNQLNTNFVIEDLSAKTDISTSYNCNWFSNI